MTTPATLFDSTDVMPADCVTGLHDLLTACADTKLLLGYHYGEWTFGTPELEAAVASCSLSQSELGHVRLLHGILKSHWGEDPDALVEGRRAEQFANVTYLDRPLTDWTAFVAMNAVVDLAVTRVLFATREGTFVPFRLNVDKMLDEERYHLHHGRGWLRTLSQGEPEACGRLVDETVKALVAVRTWLGPADDAGDRALVTAGIKGETNAQVFESVHTMIRQLAESCGLTLPDLPAADFTGWDAASRRIGTRLDEDILYHLRGSKNAIFKLN